MKSIEEYLTDIEGGDTSLRRWETFYDMVVDCFKENCAGNHVKTSDLFFEMKKRKIPEYKEMTVFFSRGQQLLAKREGKEIYGRGICF